jgi:hypothetical protein
VRRVALVAADRRCRCRVLGHPGGAPPGACVPCGRGGEGLGVVRGRLRPRRGVGQTSERSIAVLDACDFHCEGRLRSLLSFDGGRSDALVCSSISDDRYGLGGTAYVVTDGSRDRWLLVSYEVHRCITIWEAAGQRHAVTPADLNGRGLMKLKIGRSADRPRPRPPHKSPLTCGFTRRRARAATARSSMVTALTGSWRGRRLSR